MKKITKIITVFMAVFLVTNVASANAYFAQEVSNFNEVKDDYMTSQGIDFKLSYTSEVSMPLGEELSKEYLYDNGYVNYEGILRTNGSSLASDFFVTNDEYSTLNLNDFNAQQAGTYEVSIDFVDAQDSLGLHTSRATFEVEVYDDSEPVEPDFVTPEIGVDGNLNRTKNDYRVNEGIEFSLNYTSDIEVNQGQEITKDFLYDNEYVKYNGYVTSTGSELSDNFFVTSDEYATLELNDFNANETGSYTLYISFVDGQDSTGLHYSTVPFNVTVV